MDPAAVTAELARLDRTGTREAVAELGGPWDREVEAVVRAIAAAAPAERAALRGALSARTADLLRAWGERMATVAVRRGDRDLVVLGLVALSLAGEDLVDERERLIAVPLHKRAAKRVGEKPRQLFDEAAALSDEAGARWLRAQRGSRLGLRQMAFKESKDPDGAFRFEQEPPPGVDPPR